MSLMERAAVPPLTRGGLAGGPGWQYNKWLGRWRRETVPPQSAVAAPDAADEMPLEESDVALVERVKAGDLRAFELLHRRYYPRIYRFAFLRLGHAEDASDIACNTFCRALNRLHTFQFRRTNSIYPWLHQIASNLVIDSVRERPSGGLLSLDAQAAEDVDSFLEFLPADGPSLQELVERAEVQEVVRQAMNQLPADQGRALAMRFLGDLSIREIAHAMDRSEGAIKSLLHRALDGMRSHLKSTVAAARTEGALERQRDETRKRESHGTEVVHLRPRDS